MTQNYDNYGIILLSGEKTYLYLATKSQHKLLCTVTAHIPNKQGRGGQSQKRFERLRMETIHEYHKRILDKMKTYYISPSNDQTNIKGLIFAGPSMTKNKIAEHEMMDYRLKKLIMKIETTAEIRENTISEILIKVDDLLISEGNEIKMAVKKFDESLSISDGYAVYGKKQVINLLKNNMLKYLIIHQNYFDEYKQVNDLKLDELCQSNGCQMVITQSNIIEKYGGFAGLLWFPSDHNDDNDEST
jgi:peptide chain release factor subunit 1